MKIATLFKNTASSRPPLNHPPMNSGPTYVTTAPSMSNLSKDHPHSVVEYPLMKLVSLNPGLPLSNLSAERCQDIIHRLERPITRQLPQSDMKRFLSTI